MKNWWFWYGDLVMGIGIWLNIILLAYWLTR